MQKLFLYYCGVEDYQQQDPVDAFAYQPSAKTVTNFNSKSTQNLIQVAKDHLSSKVQPFKSQAITQDFSNIKQLEEALTNNFGQGVFSTGTENTSIMIIGDAPQQLGNSFSGPALALLEKMFNAIKQPLSETYQCNLCYTPEQTANEATALEMLPYLEQHIKIVAPKILVLMGNRVTRTLLRQEKGILSLRGKFHDYKQLDGKTIKALPIFHPNYLIQQPAQKRLAWEDLQALQQWLAQHG